MVIAVTYDNGNVGLHFGHAKEFKLYEFDDLRQFVEADIIEPMGSGHDAIVNAMEEYHVAVVICGNIGEEAKIGLMKRDIALCAGVSGTCDDAIMDFMNGKLSFETGANCTSCGTSENGSCGCCGDDGEDSDCAGGCGGCCH